MVTLSVSVCVCEGHLFLVLLSVSTGHCLRSQRQQRFMSDGQGISELNSCHLDPERVNPKPHLSPNPYNLASLMLSYRLSGGQLSSNPKLHVGKMSDAHMRFDSCKHASSRIVR